MTSRLRLWAIAGFVASSSAALTLDHPAYAQVSSAQDSASNTSTDDRASDPAEPLIDALHEVSAQLRATPYAHSSDTARMNTERFLTGLLAQALDFANQLGQLDAPYFSRSARIEGMPGLYNPDNVYRSALLEPQGVYRIYGQRGTHADLTFQILDKYPVVGLGKNLLVLRPDQLGTKRGKPFEIYLGGAPRAGKVWFPMPQNAMSVLARQSFGDWRETPSTIFIERLDQPPPQQYETQFARAAAALKQSTKLWVETFLPPRARSTKVNEFDPPRASDISAGGLGGQQSILARYRITKDEALLITVRKAKASYQGIQLGDPWFVTPNTLTHQISLTAQQAHVDRDGRIRFVIALQDPGVANWLDAAGNPEGYIFMRWQGMKAPLTPDDGPHVQIIPLALLKSALPSETIFVSQQERRARLADRRWVPQIR